MSTTLIAVDHSKGAEVPAPPLKESGAPYRWSLSHPGTGTLAFTDTLSEAVTVLIPGYLDMDEDARTFARVKFLNDLAAPLQAQILATWDPEAREALTESERTTLLTARHVPLVVEEWSAEVPLVLLESHYMPYTEVPAPVSVPDDVSDPPNLIWLRPGTDLTFLQSLERVGLIALGEHTDFAI